MAGKLKPAQSLTFLRAFAELTADLIGGVRSSLDDFPPPRTPVEGFTLLEFPLFLFSIDLEGKLAVWVADVCTHSVHC